MRYTQMPTYSELKSDHRYKEHHSSWYRGYVSRKNPEGETRKYEGRFGRGYYVLTPSWWSTSYCRITYFVEV